MRPFKLIAYVVLISLSVGFGALWYASGELIAPAHAVIGGPPTWMNAESVKIPTGNDSIVHGWLVSVEIPTGVVVLLHPIRGNRLSMLGRARFLSESGLSVLLIDLQAHGESDGDRITFGHLESRDALAAVNFVRNAMPGAPVVVLGSSLGGAAALLAEPKLEVDALIIEAVYPTIEVAVRNRLQIRAGGFGDAMAPLLLVQLKSRMGIDPTQLRPLDRTRYWTAPVFVISGEQDKRTTILDTKMLYDSFTGPKQLWLIPGAGHQDLHRFTRSEYETRVLQFINQVVTSAT